MKDDNELNNIVEFSEPMDVFYSDDDEIINESIGEYQLIDDDIDRLEEFIFKEDENDW